MRFKPEMLELYAITDRACLRGKSLYAAVEEAILGGASCIQLRDKNAGKDELTETAQKLVRICRSHGVPLIINDNYKIALKVGADGVHVGADDAKVSDIRRIAGSDFIIGATAKTVEQARRAERDGADYLGAGAVFPSPTKADALRITPSQLREICSCVDIPTVAIGGITLENMHELQGCRSRGIAVISAIFGSDDIRAKAAALRKKWWRIMQTHTALTIAGSDPSGGAGVQADTKTMLAHGVYAMSVITALTAQNTMGVAGIHTVSPQFLAEQLDAVFTDIRPDAVKLGMIPSREAAEVIAERLDRYKADNIVLDPVAVSTSGSELSSAEAFDAIISLLSPMSALVTPNVPETERIIGKSVKSAAELKNAARLISDKFGCNVLCKGGHLRGEGVQSFLAMRGGSNIGIVSRRIDTRNTHGTGCTLSSAAAAGLAKGMSLENAVISAENYVNGALSAMLELGHGNGPLDHGFCLKNTLYGCAASHGKELS